MLDQNREELGHYLRELRVSRRKSLRDLRRETGVSDSYISQVEQGKRRASADLLRRLAPAYGTSVKDLLIRADYLNEPEVSMSDHERIEWAFECVVSDPDYRFGTSLRLSPELTLEAKRFIIEVYEKATGRKLL